MKSHILFNGVSTAGTPFRSMDIDRLLQECNNCAKMYEFYLKLMKLTNPELFV